MFSNSSKDRQDFLRDILNGALKSAGKSKDEFVTILGREMGLAFAAMVKEPLQKIVESKRLRIQFDIELVDKNKSEAKKKVARGKKLKVKS